VGAGLGAGAVSVGAVAEAAMVLGVGAAQRFTTLRGPTTLRTRGGPWRGSMSFRTVLGKPAVRGSAVDLARRLGGSRLVGCGCHLRLGVGGAASCALGFVFSPATAPGQWSRQVELAGGWGGGGRMGRPMGEGVGC
jgi:hypothetical protein